MLREIGSMKCSGVGICAAVSALLWASLGEQTCPRKHQALAIAFLALHRGDDCRELVQRGIQQKVALEAAAEAINAAGLDLQLGLRIYDTCSDKGKAVESAARGVLFAERRCSKFPVFLGFLGPDDEESLHAIKKANGIFNYSHLVPGAVRSFQQYNIINVEMIDTGERAQGIINFLRYLNWSSFILIFTSDTISSRIAMELMESQEFCLTNTILRIPSSASGGSGFRELATFKTAVEEVRNARILMVIDDADVMNRVLSYVEGVDEPHFVVYVQGSGIIPWTQSRDIFRNTIILHEVPRSPLILPNYREMLQRSPLWKDYMDQIGLGTCEVDDRKCKPMKPEIDPTVVPYVYSIHLLSTALKRATWMKCEGEANKGMILICEDLKRMTQVEWNSILQETVAVVTDFATNKSEKIRFYMDLENGMDIIVFSEEENFEIVGSADKELKIFRPKQLKKSNRSRARQCLVDMYEYEMETGMRDTSPAGEERSMPGIAEDDYKTELLTSFGYYELVAVVVGIPIGVLLLVGVAVYCVYVGERKSSDVRPKPNLPTICDAEEYGQGNIAIAANF